MQKTDFHIMYLDLLINTVRKISKNNFFSKFFKKQKNNKYTIK